MKGKVVTLRNVRSQHIHGRQKCTFAKHLFWQLSSAEFNIFITADAA